MNGYFKRQLVDYVEYHRDPRNCLIHVFGIAFLFLGAVLPFSAWTVHIFGYETTAATIAVVPIMICWLLLDVALGVGILVAAALLIAVATMIANHSSTAGMWSITGVFIVLGTSHRLSDTTYSKVDGLRCWTIRLTCCSDRCS